MRIFAQPFRNGKEHRIIILLIVIVFAYSVCVYVYAMEASVEQGRGRNDNSAGRQTVEICQRQSDAATSLS